MRNAIKTQSRKQFVWNSFVAFPLLGAGDNGFSTQKALDIALNRFEVSMRDEISELTVYLVLFHQEDLLYAKKLAGEKHLAIIAATNMILRDDGNSNIKCEDFLRQNPAQVQLEGATAGMMNSPYSQGTNAAPSQYELPFVEYLLDFLPEGAKAAVSKAKC